MLGALIKAMFTAALLIVAPICIYILVAIFGMSYKVVLGLLAIFLPFIVIGLVYGYLAGCEAE